jgi:hypothetical protein
VLAGLTRLLQSLALMTLIKNLGRHKKKPSQKENESSKGLKEACDI